jgi:sporulation protein YlmC with PRC-barrel domain
MHATSCLDKLVLDWNGLRVGRVRRVVGDSRTGAVRSLVLEVAPEAQSVLGTPTATVPVGYVRAVRRDELSLDRSVDELARGDAPAARA